MPRLAVPVVTLSTASNDPWKGVPSVATLEGLASMAVAEGRPERAVRLVGWADAIRQTIGDFQPPVEQKAVDGDMAVARAQLDEAVFAAAYAEGQRLTMEQAIAYALEPGSG